MGAVAEGSDRINEDQFGRMMTNIEEMRYFNQIQSDNENGVTFNDLMKNKHIVAQMTEVDQVHVADWLTKYFPHDQETINAAEFGEMMTKIWASKYHYHFDVQWNSFKQISRRDLFENIKIVADLTEMEENMTRAYLKEFVPEQLTYLNEEEFCEIMMRLVTSSYFNRFERDSDNTLSLADILDRSYLVFQWCNLDHFSQSVDQNEMFMAIKLNFPTVDTDKDGKINREEFGRMMAKIEEENYFHQFDLDSDNCLRRDAISMTDYHLMAQMTEMKVEEVSVLFGDKFTEVDTDGDGKINITEFGDLVTNLWVSAHFQRFDSDDNDRVRGDELFSRLDIVAELTERSADEVEASLRKHMHNDAGLSMDEAEFGRLMMLVVGDTYFDKFDRNEDEFLTLEEILARVDVVAEWNNLHLAE